MRMANANITRWYRATIGSNADESPRRHRATQATSSLASAMQYTAGEEKLVSRRL